MATDITLSATTTSVIVKPASPLTQRRRPADIVTYAPRDRILCLNLVDRRTVQQPEQNRPVAGRDERV
jgi:hypothetical protein